MSQTNTALSLQVDWQPLCRTTDLVAGSGIVAFTGGEQVALIYLPHTKQQVFAIGNRDPKSGANVIGRGLVGSLGGELVIVSPLYKQHFRLRDGGCLEYPEQNLRVWPARLREGIVEIGSQPRYPCAEAGQGDG